MEALKRRMGQARRIGRVAKKSAPRGRKKRRKLLSDSCASDERIFEKPQFA